MILRDLKRVALLAGPLLVLMILSASLWHSNPDSLRAGFGALLGNDANANDAHPSPSLRSHRKPTLTVNETHYEIYSASSSDGKYFEIRFGGEIFNPNIIPHQEFNNTWHAVGQLYKDPDPAKFGHDFQQVWCLAQFMEDVFMCIDYIETLPIQATSGGKCGGEIDFINMDTGPREARVFFGPQTPLAIFGSNSGLTCLGQWVQDFRKLVGWEYEIMTNTDFEKGTELQRPPPYSPIEHNYFLFWDNYDTMHVHYSIYPKRGFAKLERDGSTGPDLAPKTAEHDEECLMRYLPEPPETPPGGITLESIHQATNSLKITMCNRADKDCEPHDGNTFVMAIIQHKTYYGFHGEYEPYVVLFQQRPPYELYAISKKPLWISGRKRHAGRHTDAMYVTSANWKDRGVKYHGFLDDVIFLGFGFEDKGAGMIDVRAADLLVDMGVCEEPKPL